jgi:hypothetical protein
VVENLNAYSYYSHSFPSSADKLSFHDAASLINEMSASLSRRLIDPRAFPFLSLGSREKALAPGGLLCILVYEFRQKNV